ncbi:MAG: acetoacetate--CoA ligase [Gammaproteobacteria bacterium]|nr:acetoacetate--CoA ligase [Gammaproteobacteria bacterium]
MSGNVLWEPNPEAVERTNMMRFARTVQRAAGLADTGYQTLYQWSVQEPSAFWSQLWHFGEVRGDMGERVLVDPEQMPGARWFPDARLNFAENLLRCNDATPAIVFRREDGAQRTLSHAELQIEVTRCAQALRRCGVGEGDRIAAYLPNIPEAVIGMLASASLGAVWSSSSPDFGVRGVLDRFGQIKPKVLLAADGYFYNGTTHDSLAKLAEIVAGLPSVKQVVVVGYTTDDADLSGVARAQSWHKFTEHTGDEPLTFARLAFDHPLYILYSSGTTGVPKCIVHGAGGTLLQHLKELLLHTDVRPGDRLFYFTTCGWMMWNWLVSGLAGQATLMLYDGSPFYPNGNVLFDYVADERIDIFGTSAKYIDAVNKAQLRPRETHDLSALRAILSTGSPLVPESFDFVYQHIKLDVCLSSISGGTDIVSCFALGNPTLPVRRGELQCRGLGLRVEVFDDQGRPLRGEKGELVCSAPFPCMPIGFWNDPGDRKYHKAYFERFPGVWCHGDYVELTEHDGVVIYGRSDAVLNPGGVRIGTAEIYRQAEQLDEVLESLVIGQHWRGDVRVVLFVRLREGVQLDEALVNRIREQIRSGASPRHVPGKIVQVGDIPRTKSGKIVELAVRSIVHGEPVRNREALANPEALQQFENLPDLQTD